MTASGKRYAKYSCAQDRFIRRTRLEIDSNPNYFDVHDWRRLHPKGGRNASLKRPVSLESFYVKPVASWVPDKLFENHVPSCPHCKSNRSVDCVGARWINSPKILFGISSHSYLDTKLYPCRRCGRRFTGYNRESMVLDEAKYLGYFNFYLSARFAVDEELLSFITNMYERSTSSIHKILTGMATDRYLNDQIYYLHACRANAVKKRATNVMENGQSTLDPLLKDLSEAPDASASERTLLRLQCDRKRHRLNLRSAESRAKDPIDFHSLMKIKAGRNKRINADPATLPSIGTGKLEKLIAAGFDNGLELTDYQGIHPEWSTTPRRREAFRELRESIKTIFDARLETVRKLEEELVRMDEEIQQQQEEVDLQVNFGNIELVGRDDDRQHRIINALEKKHRPFSKMTDPKGYNARIISTGRIDQILLTDFLKRKPMSQAKMIGQESEILKIDFEYKLPDNIFVARDCMRVSQSCLSSY